MRLDREELARQAFQNRIHRNPDADKAATATAAFQDADAFIAAAKADRVARGEAADDPPLPPTPDQLAAVSTRVDGVAAALAENVTKITDHINAAQDGDANRFIELTEALKTSDAQHTATQTALTATVEQLAKDVAELKGKPAAPVEIPPPPPPLADSLPAIEPPTPLEATAAPAPAPAADVPVEVPPVEVPAVEAAVVPVETATETPNPAGAA